MAGTNRQTLDFETVGSPDRNQQVTLNTIENGITSPTLRQLEAIAAALDVKITDLFDSEYK